MITQVDENAMNWLRSGDEEYISGDLEGAADKYETVLLAKELDLSPYVRANAHYNIAMVRFEEGRYRIAADHLNQCIAHLQEYQGKNNRLHVPAMSIYKFAHVLLKETARMESQKKNEEQNTVAIKQEDVDSIFPPSVLKKRRGAKRCP